MAKKSPSLKELVDEAVEASKKPEADEVPTYAVSLSETEVILTVDLIRRGIIGLAGDVTRMEANRLASMNPANVTAEEREAVVAHELAAIVLSKFEQVRP